MPAGRAFTLICRGRTAAAFGSVSVRTPLAYVLVASSTSIGSGSEILRTNAPDGRSWMSHVPCGASLDVWPEMATESTVASIVSFSGSTPGTFAVTTNSSAVCRTSIGNVAATGRTTLSSNSRSIASRSVTNGSDSGVANVENGTMVPTMTIHLLSTDVAIDGQGVIPFRREQTRRQARAIPAPAALRRPPCGRASAEVRDAASCARGRLVAPLGVLHRPAALAGDEASTGDPRARAVARLTGHHDDPPPGDDEHPRVPRGAVHRHRGLRAGPPRRPAHPARHAHRHAPTH